MTKDVDQIVIQERKKFVLCINTEKGYEVISGNVAEGVFNQVFIHKEAGEESVKGMTACGGKASGVVHIIRKVHDIINVKDGDILIASMTRPEMVVAMKRAAGIVTDEGGITSHAAVVSRELKKPCVIGTKNATKVFKDGDHVEVDADHGIVRKISKAQ